MEEHSTLVTGETFKHQTIHIVDQSYESCTFVSCTIILRNSSSISLSGCKFVNCNWHVDFLFSQNNKEVVSALKSVLSMIAANNFEYGKMPLGN